MSDFGDILLYEEPRLLFRHDQALEDPRDGLTLFGPLDDGRPYGVRAAVIGTGRGIRLFQKWVHSIQQPLHDATSPIARPTFPGFEAAFRIPWNPVPVNAREVSEEELLRAVRLDDRYQRVHRAVSIFSERILESIRSDDTAADVWFVVIPDVVYEYCRPQSTVAADVRLPVAHRLNPRMARGLRHAPSLFPEENQAAEPYQYDVDFHNQLKARLLGSGIPVQIVRESTIFPASGDAMGIRPSRDVRGMEASIAWNLSTAAFYKSGGRPWKISGVREGVCYLGLVFKRTHIDTDARFACCAAQMFLDSGDGVVFKGAVGPWYSTSSREFHLSREAARQIVKTAVSSFFDRTGTEPREIFIHGKAAFSDEEWIGFSQAVSPSTQLVGIRIQDENDFRLFRMGSMPVLRGSALIRHERSAYLWTKGFAPRLRTYAGREVPRPIRVEVLRGSAEMRQVLSDILWLTKLNYNTCILADGTPVTLRFADAVGEILTASPDTVSNPLPFKFYI